MLYRTKVYLLINLRERLSHFSHCLKSPGCGLKEKLHKSIDRLVLVSGLDDGLDCSRYRKFEKLTATFALDCSRCHKIKKVYDLRYVLRNQS